MNFDQFLDRSEKWEAVFLLVTVPIQSAVVVFLALVGLDFGDTRFRNRAILFAFVNLLAAIYSRWVLRKIKAREG